MTRPSRTSTADIARAIARRHAGADVAELLADTLAPAELNSLLLHAMRARAARAGFPSVLRFAEDNALVHASKVDARAFARFDALAFAAADGFEAVELSPVSVLGMNALAGVDQNNVLSATRGVEVVADPTSAMAVECARARRRPEARRTTLRLCTSHRLIRMQPFDNPSFSRHFRLFALAHAGRDVGDERFEQESLVEQCGAWLRLARELGAHGYDVAGARVEISDTRIVSALLREHGVDDERLRGHVSPVEDSSANARLGLALPAAHEDPARALPPGRPRDLERMARVEERVLAPLRRAFPGTETRFDFQKLHGLRYYDGLTLSLIVRGRDGREYPIGDGGFSAWTQQLLGDRKERFLASAIGSEMVCKALAPRAG